MSRIFQDHSSTKKERDFDEIHAKEENPTVLTQAGISAISENRWTAAQGSEAGGPLSCARFHPGLASFGNDDMTALSEHVQLG
jgi:hypothetical protein